MVSGDQGNMWHQANIPVTPVGGQVQVRFKATRGSSFTSDTAIDDFRFGESESSWEPNSAEAFLDIDGAETDGFCSPAIINKSILSCGGVSSSASGTLNFGTSFCGGQFGGWYEIAFNALPIRSAAFPSTASPTRS